MTEQDKEQLNIEISHIFESGANHLRIFEMVENFIDKRYKAINYTHCCKSVKDKYTHTFEVDLNSEKRKEQYNKQIEQIHNAPCKVYFYDGENYIELKT